MSIETEVTQEDYEAFARYGAASCSVPNPKKFISNLMGWGIGLLVGFFVAFTWLGENRTTLAATFCGALLGALLMLLLLGSISRRQMRRMKPYDDGFVIGNQKLTLCEEGIRQTSRHHQVLVNWSCLRSVITTDKHVFVMVDRIAGFILRSRSFTSDEQREQFVTEIIRQSGKLFKKRVIGPPSIT